MHIQIEQFVAFLVFRRVVPESTLQHHCLKPAVLRHFACVREESAHSINLNHHFRGWDIKVSREKSIDRFLFLVELVLWDAMLPGDAGEGIFYCIMELVGGLNGVDVCFRKILLSFFQVDSQLLSLTLELLNAPLNIFRPIVMHVQIHTLQNFE